MKMLREAFRKARARYVECEVRLIVARAQIADLEAENKALHSEIDRAYQRLNDLKRPPMTREVPRVEGWYWMKHELTICKPFPAEVFNRNGVMCLQEEGRYYKPVNEYAIAIWSARPIEMDPIVKEEQ